MRFLNKPHFPLFLLGILSAACAVAQSPSEPIPLKNDTIYANTQPVGGFRPFIYNLQTALSQADTVGRRHKMRVNNIAFFVNQNGAVDSTWIMFRPRPIHNDIMKFLRTTRWIPARQDGAPVVSVQDMDIEIYLTKSALKRYGYWRSLPERLLSPFSR